MLQFLESSKDHAAVKGPGWLPYRHVSQSVSHYHTPSRELMAHTLTLLTRVRVRRVSLDQGKYRVEGDVFYLLRFFLTMPSRDVYTRQLAHRGVDEIIAKS